MAKEVKKKELKKEAKKEVKNNIYDVIIIGAGAAGYCAAIYAARYKMKALVIGKQYGGVAAEAYIVENYPGYNSIKGFELMEKWREHVKYLGVKVMPGEVDAINKVKEGFEVFMGEKNRFVGKSLIMAIGLERRKLNLEGEDKLTGKGIHYCATCDSPFYKGKITAVVGGNDSAASAALLLAEYCPKVYIIYRKEKIRAEPYWVDLVEKNDKIEVLNTTNVVKAFGKEKLEEVELDNEYKGSKKLKLEGLFIEIGSVPNIALIEELKLEHDGGYIKVNTKQETSVAGVWAAGDVTSGSLPLKQIIIAAAQGAQAANGAFVYVKSLEAKKK
ncbi:FAD-dependent oxidoreductase [Candidatus Woesearchaeota archaeon]|nr:FAD-dependent oxidoreductase [Candidatus Woesearchaeota archaeon]